MKIFVAIPCYGGVINCETTQSLLKMMEVFRKHKIEAVVEFLTTESLISRGRNTLVAKFLMSDSTHLLFIDADLIFNPVAVLKMLNENVELIGCPYPKKKYNWLKVAKYGGDFKNIGETQTKFTDINYNVLGGEMITKGSVIPAKDIPTGFMLIRRSVFATLMANYPERNYKNNIAGLHPNMADKFYDFFGTGIVDGYYLSEDYYFCYLCREVGIDLWLETGFTFGHIGRFTYFGNLAEQLQDDGDKLNEDKLITQN